MGFQIVAQDSWVSCKTPEWKLQTSQSKPQIQAKFAERFAEAHETLNEPASSPKLGRGEFQMNLRWIIALDGKEVKLSFSCASLWM